MKVCKPVSALVEAIRNLCADRAGTVDQNVVLTIDTCPIQRPKYYQTIIPRKVPTSRYKDRSNLLASSIPSRISLSSRSYSGLS